VLGLGIRREPPDLPLLQDQVSRMQGIVDHQLSRVARIAQTETALDRPWVSVGPVVQRLIRALSVSYAENEFEFPAHEDIALRIHEDDLLDILGNVLENACKHGARRVRVSISGSGGGEAVASKQPEGAGLVLCVEDDGPGIEQSQVASVLSRGARLDSQAPGQGIGLAMVVELLSAYEGSMDIQPSALGGVAVWLHFPQARPEKATRS
jgi:two-component system sensor histidine kinase PhoQ